MRGNRDRAVELQRRVLASREAMKQEREIVMASVNLATALLEGDHEEPEVLAEVDALAESALALAERTGPVGLRISPLLLRIDVALRRRDLAAASAWLEQALVAARDPSAAVDKQLQVRTVAVEVALAKKDTAAAKAAIDEAELAVLRSDEILSLGTSLFVLAKARWQLDYDRARAIEMAQRAEAMFVKRKDTSGRLDDVRAWLKAHR